MSERKIKVLMAKPGLDGHDVGAKVVVRALMDAGFEVLYTGLRQTPDQIATVAQEEDVDVVGFSVLSGSHVPLCQAFKAERERNQIEDKLWIVGGNIPSHDVAALQALGVDGVFRTDTRLDDIISFIREKVHERHRA